MKEPKIKAYPVRIGDIKHSIEVYKKIGCTYHVKCLERLLELEEYTEHMAQQKGYYSTGTVGRARELTCYYDHNEEKV